MGDRGLASYNQLLEVAAAIDREWRAYDNNCEAFPEIVWRLTDDLDVSALGELAELTALLDHPYVASIQEPSTFSDLYLKLYDNGRFWIEVLNWWGSDINIHDHNFSGIQFQLAGSSLNVVYRFDIEMRLTNLDVGVLAIAKAEIWNAGTRSVVQPGRVEPHNVSHLDSPTVSLLIRTHPVALYGHQSNYLPPDLTGNYGVADIVFRKKVGALRLAARGDIARFNSMFAEVITTGTHADNLFTMLKTADVLFHPDHVGLVSDYASRGELEERIVRCVAYYRAQHYVANSLKYQPDVTGDDLVTIGMLASAYDRATFERIGTLLDGADARVDSSTRLACLRSHLRDDHVGQYDRVVELLGLMTPPAA
jgi:hypothetical protein